MTGRGAWPISGLGGTLEYDGKGGTRPGPYYMLAAKDTPKVGSKGWSSTVADERAVHGGVQAIQWALNRVTAAGLTGDGVFGQKTYEAVLRWQNSLPASYGVTVWGGVGQASAEYLFLPRLQEIVPESALHVVYGLIQAESGWDPGAVGYYDPEDWGLGQINGPANPTLSERERLRPKVAFEYMYKRYENSLRYFRGDQRTAIASYNLGMGGATQWKAAGSPDYWTPAGADTPRNVKGYIDKILSAYPA